MRRAAHTAQFSSFFALACGTLVGCGSAPLVDGECRSGLTECSLACVDLNNDDLNCGTCGNVCPAGEACFSGGCARGSKDGSRDGSPDGGGDDSGRNDASGDGNPDANADVSADGSDGNGGGGNGGSGTGGAGGDGNVGGDGNGGTGGDGGIGGNAGDSSLDGDGSGGNINPDGDSSQNPDGNNGDSSQNNGDSSQNNGDSSQGDGGVDEGSLVDGPDLCVPPFNTSDHCGDCFTSCGGATPICAFDGLNFACKALCDLPLQECNGQCVDFNSDELHCGNCITSCPSAICQHGFCVGAKFGHVVVMGMDFTVAPTGNSPTVTLGNAAFLPSHNPVRVLGFDQFADPAVIGKITTALDAAAGSRGRQYQLTRVSTNVDVLTKLQVGEQDVFLVYDQLFAPPGAMAGDGNLWNNAMENFAKAGGTVIVLDGGKSLVGGVPGAGTMSELLTLGGLLNVTGEENATGLDLSVEAPGDAVGLNVDTPFRARENTVGFLTPLVPDSRNIVVVKTVPADGGVARPVVIHSVKVP